MKPGINLNSLRYAISLGLALWACMLSVCMFIILPLIEVVQ